MEMIERYVSIHNLFTSTSIYEQLNYYTFMDFLAGVHVICTRKIHIDRDVILYNESALQPTCSNKLSFCTFVSAPGR